MNNIQIYSDKLDTPKSDIINSICSAIKSKHHSRAMTRLREVDYISSDNGPMEDELACVNIRCHEAVFVIEGSDYPNDYDFDTDPNGIVVAYMCLEDLTVPNLLRVISVVKMGGYRLYLEQFNRLCYQVFNVFKGIDPGCKYTINEVVRMYGDRSWQDYVITDVTRVCYYLKDDFTPYSFDELPFDQLCIIADVVETILMREWENPLPGAN